MDEQKEKMDDLASLFLPDLLHPLSSLNSDALVKQEDDGFHAALFQNDQPKMSSYPSGMNMQMANTDQDYLLLLLDPDNMYSMSMGSGPASNHLLNYANQGNNMRFLPYAAPQEEGLSHTLHYQDFIPAEAGLQPPMRFHQMQKQYFPQHVMPFQQAWSPLTVIGQFDGMNYYGSMSPQGPYGQNMAGPTPGYNDTENLLFGASKTATPDALHGYGHDRNTGSLKKRTGNKRFEEETEHTSRNKDRPRNLKKRERSPGDLGPDSLIQKHATASTIKIDYNPRILKKLLDLKDTHEHPPVQIFDHANKPVDIDFRGFISGRFYTNDQDNFNHISATKEEPQIDKTYKPEVICCYRRNFIHINLNFHRSSEYNLLAILGKGVINSFRIDVLAFANGEECKRIPVIINREKESMKDRSKGYSDVVLPRQIDTSHKVLVEESARDNYFTIRKAQFKSATANSIIVNYQTFNNFTIRLVAELDREEVIVKELKSTSIIVRGRNPSFYQKKGDIQIKSRPAVSKSSFTLSEQDVNDDELLDHEFSASQQNVDLQPQAAGSPDTDGTEKLEIKLEPKESSISGTPEEQSAPEADEDNLEEAKTVLRLARQTPVASGAPLAANLKELLDSKSFVDADGKPTRYRYFPISNVYYLPPINVVYFPHRAHQLKQESSSDANAEDGQGQPTEVSRRSVGNEKKKPTSKFYFK